MTDLQMIESVALTSTEVFLAALELARAVLHSWKPYESHTEVSGLADAAGLEGLSLDAAALITYQFGFCSFLAFSGYLIPLIFGDPTKEITLYLISLSYFFRTLQSLGIKRKIWAPV